MRLVLIAMLALASPLLAEDWKMRSEDVLFDQAGLRQELSGKTLVFFDDGRSVYGEDGYYSYTYGGGGTWEGRWRVEDSSLVCVTFVTDVTRCDRIVRHGDRLVVLTSDGERFPVKQW